jgi:acetylglutamate kinase
VSFVVIKLGGELIRGRALTDLASEIAALAAKIVIVHGGGPQTTALQKALGQTPVIVGGRRITDDAALEALKMAVAGAANVDLCAALTAAGLRPVGLHDGIRARKRPPRVVSGAGPGPIDLGHVGDVVGFDRSLLELLARDNYLPVLACLGADEQGNLFNINADIVATRLAIDLGAADLIVLTGVAGVLEKVGDPSSRRERLTIAEARALIASGVVSGGMIPKLEESFVALEGGVQRVHLLDRGIAQAIERPGSTGTLLLA